jgi:DnaA family protein
MRQLPLPLAGAVEPRLDNFLPGVNAVLLQELRARVAACLDPPPARSPTALPPPVYLWGPAGSGKSHLLQAIGHALRTGGSRVRVLAGIGPDDSDAADPGRVEEGAAGVALVTIDDCDRLDEGAQARAFRAFVDAAGSGSWIVAAGRVPPVDLPLREDLRSRLGWGPVFALAPLTDEQARAGLRGEAGRRGIALADGLLDHLLTHFARDLKHLMALLDRLDRYALARSRAVTLPLLRQMLDDPDAP